MTRRRKLEEHRENLGEIRGIMNSMKTLAYLETRKLARFLHSQQAMVASIESMAADFVSFFPETLPTDEGENAVYLLVGSERGFCGNFNESLLPAMESCVAESHNTHNNVHNNIHNNIHNNKQPMLVAIGHKLHTSLETDSRVVARIDGANVVEEIEAVMARITQTLLTLQARYPSLSLFVLYHGGGQPNQQEGDEQQVLMQKLLSPFQRYLGKQAEFSHPPILNVAPADFLLELTDHYLFAALHEILYTSLMAENHRRVQHLDGAVQHLDEKENELSSQCNALRQEEIIEEIEVILLSAESLM